MSGKKHKLKKVQLEKIISENLGEESVQFLIDFKILFFGDKIPSFEQSPLSLPEFLAQGDEFSILTGIECAEDFLKTPSGGLKLTLGAIVHLLETFMNFKAVQSKIQSAVREMQTLPLRSDPNQMFVLLETIEDSTSSTPKKDIEYCMTDIVYTFLNTYNPLSDQVNDLQDGSIFLNLLETSSKISKLVIGSTIIKTKITGYLKTLDSQLVLKRNLALIDVIVLRELFISSYSNFFDDFSRIENLKSVLDSLANDSKIGKTMLLDAERTANPLPSVFEFIDPHDKPVGVVEDFLSCFSRLCIANVISMILSIAFDNNGDIFRPKPGISIFQSIYSWLLLPTNRLFFEQLFDLLTEAEYLVNYYSQEEIETISKDYKENSES